jgi:hypothetical protein
VNSDASKSPAERGLDFLLRLGVASMAVFYAITVAALLVFQVIQSANKASFAAGYTTWQMDGDEWWWSHFVPGHLVALSLVNPCAAGQNHQLHSNVLPRRPRRQKPALTCAADQKRHRGPRCCRL